ncbi:hypothetical protein ASU31_18000 [Pedobacter ginsenosidimutans]|uniref:Uncharacterized protein n=1 Tax=Pedobacter ginsenosidimutans TaxID=687842 RepID=A0A0T5VM53_9SPHI|nr:hypothetical protein ASU31_18000 [Pedobacter ginsenosidimutans]
MNFEYLSLGSCALLIAYTIYFFGIKDKTHSLKDPNGNGPTMANYYSQFIWIAFLVIFGMIYIIRSFPEKI